MVRTSLVLTTCISFVHVLKIKIKIYQIVVANFSLSHLVGNREEMILNQKAGLKHLSLQIEDLQFENKQLRAKIADLRRFLQIKHVQASKGHPSGEAYACAHILF